jgi:hypothetical protein
LAPVRRVRACDGRRVDEVEVLGVRRGPTGPVVGALERDRGVNDHRLGVRHPRPVVYPDRRPRRGERLDPAGAPAWRAPIGDDLDINPTLFGADKRADQPGADRQLVQEINLGFVGALLPDPVAPVGPPVAGALEPLAPPSLMPGLVSCIEGLVWMLRSPPPSAVPEGPLPPLPGSAQIVLTLFLHCSISLKP